MAIGPVVTRGYAVGSVNLVVVRGYSAGATVATATITGTIFGATEADINTGGKTIIITLTGDTWVAAGALFDAQRQAIINGLTSAQSETGGWNAKVRDVEVVTAVVRTSNTVVTVTLTPHPAYNIAFTETITVTVPSSALSTSLVAVVGAPTFTVRPLSGDFHDGTNAKRHDDAQRKRWEEQIEEARLLREQIETAYADVTGERKVPDVAEIAATQVEVKKWKEPETRKDGLAYLAHIRTLLDNLNEIEQHMAMMRKVEEEDIAWIVGQLGDYL